MVVVCVGLSVLGGGERARAPAHKASRCAGPTCCIEHVGRKGGPRLGPQEGDLPGRASRGTQNQPLRLPAPTQGEC